MKARGGTDREIEAYISYVIKVLRYKYRITLLRKRGAQKEIRRILLLGATDWS